MDDSFIIRVRVGGGWSHTYAHTAVQTQKYLIALLCSVSLLIL